MNLKDFDRKDVEGHAEYLRSDEPFDYYTVDLIATAERLGIH